MAFLGLIVIVIVGVIAAAVYVVRHKSEIESDVSKVETEVKTDVEKKI